MNYIWIAASESATKILKPELFTGEANCYITVKEQM